MDAAGAQIQGDRRRQEDAFAVERLDDAGVLAVVADGLGGHPAGHEASRDGVAELGREFAARRAAGAGEAKDWLREAVLAAHRRLVERQQGEPELYSMATTMVAVYVRDGRLSAACVGDSFLLLLRQERLYLLNELHSANGGITSSVGFHLTRLDLADALPLEPGDRLLLATDGLAPLGEEDIARILGSAETAAAAARALVEAVAALEAPEQDNATAVVLIP